MKNLCLIIILSLLTISCATVSTNQVMIFDQDSTLISKCEQIKPVSLQVPYVGWSEYDVASRAITKEAIKYGADSAVILEYWSNPLYVYCQGILLDCFKKMAGDSLDKKPL